MVPGVDPNPNPPAVPVHPDVLALSFLLGTWRGDGLGGYPGMADFTFEQEVTFWSNGEPYLGYSSRTWGPDGTVMALETGWWRLRGNDVELLLAHPMGVVEVWLGTLAGTRIDLATDVVARTPSANEVTAGRRLYGLVEHELMYAYDMAAVGQSLQPHVSARLSRSRRT